MKLRSPTVDNFIHWNYTLECTETLFEIMGLHTRTQIRAYSVQASTEEWAQLEANLLKEFSKHRKELADIKLKFEHWHLFVNPYQRLSRIVERYEKRLRAITIPRVQSPPIPATRDQIARFRKEMETAMEVYQEASSLSISLQMLAPVMGEAAINFFMMVLMKPEVRTDNRIREVFARDPIDVRIKALHMHCNGFEQGVTGTEDQFRDFLSLMDRRNDRLHGNIDPRKTTGEEIFFDLGNIPLFLKHQGFAELARSSALADLSVEEALADVRVVRSFVAFLLSLLEPGVNTCIKRAMEDLQLGFRRDSHTIGVILPHAHIDFFPLVDDAFPSETND